MSHIIKRCQKLSKDVKGCQKMSKVVKRCLKLSKDVESYQKVSKVAKRCKTLSKNVKGWQKMSEAQSPKSEARSQAWVEDSGPSLPKWQIGPDIQSVGRLASKRRVVTCPSERSPPGPGGPSPKTGMPLRDRGARSELVTVRRLGPDCRAARLRQK